MPIQCPYCNIRIRVDDLEPGRYKPACARCQGRFLLVIHHDAAEPPAVKRLKDQTPGTGSDQAATIPPEEYDQLSPLPASPAPAAASSPSTSRVPPTPMPVVAATAATMAAGSSDRSAEVDQATTVVSSSQHIPGGKPLVGRRLDGYEVLEEIGRGAMGSVYLARQVSLDRNVAVKVMNSQWAADPVFVSRFTREAYAAAQLVHHNIVQIYDLGDDDAINYFSMELVDGGSLLAEMKRHGKLSVEQASGYILQAARGLEFAHEHGMVHRDVKPDNLLVNSHGVVKVADLGLVKTPDSYADDAALPRGSNAPDAEQLLDRHHAMANESGTARSRELTGGAITKVRSGMGTPAYMAPEQALDSAQVDHRADIYALGCTFYTLLTGRFARDVKSTHDLLTKLKSEPITPPMVHESRIPQSVSDIVMKMVEANPDRRYQDLDHVIAELESFLGVESDAPFSPGETHAIALERATAEFNASKPAALRKKLIIGFFGVCLGTALFGLIAGMAEIGLAAVLTPIFAFLSYQIIGGLLDRRPLFNRMRLYIFESRWTDRFTAAGLAVLFLVLLVFFDLMLVALGALAVSALLALGFSMSVDKWTTLDRAKFIDAINATLRSMRLRGMDEKSIQQFVCRFAGDNWEPLFESLFGYDAKIAARERWERGEQSRTSKKYAAWRDPIIRWLDRQVAERRAAREERHLRKIESKALQAQGATQQAADRQATASAAQIMASAVIAQELETAAVHKKRIVIKRSRGILETVIGPRTRFVVGALLVLVCVLWMNQNDLIPGRELQAIGTQLTDDGGPDLDSVQDIQETVVAGYFDRVREAKPLSVPWLPGDLDRHFDDFAPGLAGLILLLASLVSGWRLTVLLVPGILIMFLGPEWGIPGMWGMSSNGICLILGLLVCIPGWLLAR